MQKQLSPRAFMALFLAIWAAGLVPSGLLAFVFAHDRHPFAPLAIGLFALMAAGGTSAYFSAKHAFGVGLAGRR